MEHPSLGNNRGYQSAYYVIQHSCELCHSAFMQYRCLFIDRSILSHHCRLGVACDKLAVPLHVNNILCK